MTNTGLAEHTDLAAMQAEYKTAVEQWIKAIREEEALASVHPTLAQVDDWEEAHFAEEEARKKAKKAKQHYEEAIRRAFFGF
jgi:hypothetical protein